MARKKVSKIDIQKIAEKNPLVDTDLLEKSQEVSRRMRPHGKQGGYNIVSPFNRRPGGIRSN